MARRLLTGCSIAAIVVPAALIGALWLEHRSEVALPEPTGPFAVGRDVYDWTDGKRESYTVYKGSDPRALDQAEAHLVRGHAWVDSHASSSPIVYYRIE